MSSPCLTIRNCGGFRSWLVGPADLLDRARRQLPLLSDEELVAEREGIACSCTDRRAPRCGCRRGHTLACVFAKAPLARRDRSGLTLHGAQP